MEMRVPAREREQAPRVHQFDVWVCGLLEPQNGEVLAACILALPGGVEVGSGRAYIICVNRWLDCAGGGLRGGA